MEYMAMEDQGQMNELFNHFLPLMERYLPFEPTATYLIQSNLLTRKEYFVLKKDSEKHKSNVMKSLVDVVADKGPTAFVRFFCALEYCVDDSDDTHLGLEHVLTRIRQYLRENGLVHVVTETSRSITERNRFDRGRRLMGSKCTHHSMDSLLVGCLLR